MSSIVKEGRGCRILDFINRNSLADEKFFDRIETISQMWLYKGERFNYLWFYLKDISGPKAEYLISNIKGFEYDKKTKAYIKTLKNKNTPK